MSNDTQLPSAPSYNMAFVWRISLVAAMGGLLFGYDWVVIGGAKPFYETFFRIEEMSWLQGWAMSSALVGCLAGAVISGMLADRFGRKRLLVTAAVLFTASAIGTALASDFTWFNVFRIVGGVGIGLASSLSPMYIAEVSPAAVRGRLVSVNQLTIVIGILAAQVVNWLIAQPVPEDASAEFIRQSWNGELGWRWMFGAETVPAVAFLLLMFFVPESPRWLAKFGRDEQAEGVLRRVGGEAYARAELADIRATLASEEIGHVRFTDLLEPRVFRIVLLGAILAFYQQWCGINVIFNYAHDIFREAGYGVSSNMVNIVITGITNLVFTFVAIFTVDRVGRRPLMLIGSAGLAVIYAILGTCYSLEIYGPHMLILVVAGIGCYAMSLAPVVWVVLSEIFPNRIRGAAMAVAVFTLWTGCTTLTFSFPILFDGFETATTQWDGLGMHGVFWVYGVICLLGFAYIFIKLPETKGKSLEQIERELVD